MQNSTPTTGKNYAGVWAIISILLVLVLDQWSKIYVKLHFLYRESVEVFSWFHIAFIENNGMAYGMEIGDKLYLTIFRILAVAFFAFILWRGCRMRVSTGLIIALSLVVSGAMGNIIDCICYGRLFNDSFGRLAEWTFNGAEGYAPWFEGRVVDMLYFPLVEFEWPSWVPRAGEMVNWGLGDFAWPSWLPCSNEPFRFFEPIFNIADSAICVGVGVLALFYPRSFMELWEKALVRNKKNS